MFVEEKLVFGMRDSVIPIKSKVYVKLSEVHGVGRNFLNRNKHCDGILRDF